METLDQGDAAAIGDEEGPADLLRSRSHQRAPGFWALRTEGSGLKVGDRLPAIKDLVSYKGDVYATPFYGSLSFTFYRKIKQRAHRAEHPGGGAH